MRDEAEVIPNKEDLNAITQDDINKAHSDFDVFDKVEPSVIPTPTRSFELEETVRLGGLADIQVKEILHRERDKSPTLEEGAQRILSYHHLWKISEVIIDETTLEKWDRLLNGTDKESLTV